MAALGSLVVKLGLEYAQFTGGLDKSEQAALAASKKIQDTFDGMKRGIAATAGAVAGGLAAAFTVSAFKGLMSGAIATGAALDDLSMQTGATVEALSGLAEVGKFNDMGPEKIGAAMNMLTRNLAGATEESKGTGAAIRALGLDMGEFRNMKPEEQMQAVATALDGVQDGAGKSAVMMALYGKEGAQMLPFMKDLASVGELQAKVTTEQAAAAAQLDDNWVKLTTTGGETAKEVAMGMVPAFDDAVRAIMDVMSGTNGMRETLRGLVADGSIKEWTTTAIKGLSYVADAGQIAWRVLQSIGKGVGGLLAAMDQSLQGDFKGAWNSLKDAGKDMIDVFDAPTVGARFRESLDKVTTSAAAAGESVKKPAIDFRNLGTNTKGAGKAADEAKDPFDALRDTIVKSTAAYQAEATAGEKLTEGQKKAIDVLDQVRSGKVNVTQAQAIQIGKDIEAMLAAEGENKAREAFIKIADAERAARLKTVQTMEQAAASVQASNDSMREEIELMGLTEEQQVRVLQQRNQTIILTKEATLAELERATAITGTMTREQIALAAEIEALKERNELLGAKGVKNTAVEAAKKAEDEWKKTTDQINESLTDALMRGFESGKDFAKNLRDTVVNMFKTMVLRPVISAIINPVAGALTGAMGLSGAAQAAGGISTAMSGASFLGNAAGILGGAGTAAGYGASALFAGNGLGALSGGFGMLTGGGGLGMAAQGAGMIAGVLGPIALGVGAVVSLVKKLDDSGTMHTGALSQYSAAGGLANSTTHGAFGMGFGGVDYSAETEKFTGAMAQSIVMMLDSTATTFGKEAGYKAATAFADDTSKDGAWGGLLITKLNETIINWDPSRTSKWAPKEFADGAAGKEQYLAAVAADVRVALESIGLPAWATGMLNKLGQGASIEQLAGAIDQINAAKAAFAGFAQYMPIFAGLADSALGKLVDASGGVGALAGNMSAFVDGFYTDAEKLAVNTQNVTDALAKLGFEMPKTREEFKTLVASQLAIAGLQLGSSGEMIRVSQAMNESAATSAAGLLALSGAVSAVLPVTDSVTESVKAMTKSLDDFITRTARSSTEADRIRGLQAVGNTAALKRLGVPGYASGGYHSGGLRLVGENGPELEVTGPANLISNPVTEQLLRGSGSGRANTARLEALVEKLTAEVANLRAETRAVVTHTATTARIIKRVTPDGDAIATREAAPV